MSPKIVVISGAAGGMSAGTRLRRLMGDAEIVVIERGAEVSGANCGLPYYVGGTIADRSSLLLQTVRRHRGADRRGDRPDHGSVDRRGLQSPRPGPRVTLVQRGSQELSPLDPELAGPLAEEVGAHGIDLRLGTSSPPRCTQA